MQQLAYDYEVQVEARYSSEDLDTLIRHGKDHYDGKCREVCTGFLETMRLVLGEQESETWTLNFRELDTLNKILEMGVQTGDTAAMVLKSQITLMLRSINAEYKRLK